MKHRHLDPAARRRAVALPAAIVAAALGCAGAVDAAASSRMYKCIIGSRTVYQQQACPAEAEPAASAASTVAAASAAREGKLKPAARAASSVPAKPR